MENIDKLTELFQPVFDECHVRLYEIVWLGNEKTLQVAIDNDAHAIDLDICAEVSEKLGVVLDKYDPIKEEYSLEVCSPGAEREIKDYAEFEQLVDEYIYIELKEPIKNMVEFYGYVRAVSADTISLEYRDKAVKRTATIEKNNIRFARLAIKL